jgi:hypothetical protein
VREQGVKTIYPRIYGEPSPRRCSDSCRFCKCVTGRRSEHDRKQFFGSVKAERKTRREADRGILCSHIYGSSVRSVYRGWLKMAKSSLTSVTASQLLPNRILWLPSPYARCHSSTEGDFAHFERLIRWIWLRTWIWERLYLILVWSPQ